MSGGFRGLAPTCPSALPLNTSVRVSAGLIGPEVRAYLEDLYTDGEGRMVCQGCQREMLFKRPDGKYYFEAVEFIKSSGKELPQNFIALCPVCAAKFRNTLQTSDEMLRAALFQSSVSRIGVV